MKLPIVDPTADDNIEWVLREGGLSDRPFVLSSWVGSDRATAQGQRCGPCHTPEHRALIERILDRSRVSVRIACDVEDTDAILGWACASFDPAPGARPVVYYVYVRDGIRRRGIARALLSDLQGREVWFTHEPPDPRGFRYPSGWQYNPYRNWRG